MKKNLIVTLICFGLISTAQAPNDKLSIDLIRDRSYSCAAEAAEVVRARQGRAGYSCTTMTESGLRTFDSEAEEKVFDDAKTLERQKHSAEEYQQHQKRTDNRKEHSTNVG